MEQKEGGIKGGRKQSEGGIKGGGGKESRGWDAKQGVVRGREKRKDEEEFINRL